MKCQLCHTYLTLHMYVHGFNCLKLIAKLYIVSNCIKACTHATDKYVCGFPYNLHIIKIPCSI